MDKKVFCLLIMLFGLQLLKAQDSLRQERIVSLNLTSYLVSHSPRWTAGYTQKVSRRWWAGIDAGYGNSWFAVHGREGDFLTKDYSLFEIRPAVYYDLRPTSKLKHLLSVELFYIHQEDSFHDNWYYDKPGYTAYDYDAADYKRVKTGFNLNLNTIYYFGKRIVLWQQIGGGIRNRKVTYSNIINQKESTYDHSDEIEEGNMFGIDNRIRNEGSDLGFNFNLSFKLAYIF